MTRNELVKLAYAYGASVALQEAGYDPAEAENAGIKLAEEADDPRGGYGEDPSTKQKVLSHLLGPIAAGASAPQGAGWGRFGRTYGYGALGGGAGMLGGGALGAGAGAGLAKLLGKDPAMGGIAGGALGFLGGGMAGQQLGVRKGLQQAVKAERRALEEGRAPSQR